MSSASPLGGASADGLRASAANLAGGVTAADIVPWDAGWEDVFALWAPLCTEGKVVLLFSESARIDAVAAGVDADSLIFTFGLEQSSPSPGVYVLGRTASGNAWKLPHSGADYQANCKMVLDSGLRKLPAIILGNHGGAVLFFPAGLEQSDDGGFTLPARTSQSALSDLHLTAELEHFSKRILPEQAVRAKLWQDAPRYWPIRDAEKTIQSFLLIALRQVFKPNLFIAEPDVLGGRLDILILPRESNGSGRSLLELKVVRQFSETGNEYPLPSTALESLRKGIVQAKTYISATHKYLCAFDMRKDRGESLFTTIEVECNGAGVKLRRYDVPNSSQAVRDAIGAST
jgi:hypothetical protein